MTINDEIRAFYDTCTDMIRSNFILAKSKLAEIFKTIAAGDMLTDLFSSVVEGYHYRAAKASCFTVSSDGKNVTPVIVLPQSPQEKIAFIFCLLVEIGENSIMIGNSAYTFDAFLQKYYRFTENYAKSYDDFCSQIMVPFRDIVCNAFYQGEEESDDEQAAYVQEVPVIEEQPIEAEPIPEDLSRVEISVPEEAVEDEEPFLAEEEPLQKEETTSFEENSVETEIPSIVTTQEEETPLAEESAAIVEARDAQDVSEQYEKENDPTLPLNERFAAYEPGDALVTMQEKNEIAEFSPSIENIGDFSSRMEELLYLEKEELKYIDLSPKQFAIAKNMLEELSFYISINRLSTIKTILWGYHYLLLYCQYTSENLNEMYKAIEEYEKILK